MTVRRNMVLTSIVIAIALIIGLSRLAYWPAWLEVALIAVIGAGGLLVAVRQPDGPGQSWNASPVSEVAPDPPPVEYQREPLTDVRLSSNRADYSFRLAATVWWLPITAAERNAAGLSGLAINDIVRRAGEHHTAGRPGRLLASHVQAEPCAQRVAERCDRTGESNGRVRPTLAA